MVVPPLLVPQDLTYFQRDRSPVGKICEKSEDEEKKSQKRESEKKRAREMGAVSVVPPIPRIVREEVRRSVMGPRCSMSGLVRVFVLFRGLLFFFRVCRGLGLGDVGRLNRRGRWGLRFGSVVGGQYPRYPRAWVRAKNLEKRSKNLKKFPKNLKKLQKNSRRRVVQNVTRKRYRLHFCRVLLSRRSPGQCSDNFSTSFGQLNSGRSPDLCRCRVPNVPEIGPPIFALRRVWFFCPPVLGMYGDHGCGWGVPLSEWFGFV